MNLDDDARPSNDDLTDIISSVTAVDDEGAQFQALCDASTSFGDEAHSTNEKFMAACEAWVAANPA